METVEVQTNEMLVVIEQNHLEKETANTLIEKFTPFFEQAKQWKEKADALVVTDISQVYEMRMAGEARKALKNIRVNADKTRKALKEDSLRYGRAVQGVYNVIEYLIAPIEEHLENQEKFAERKEAERKEKLKAERMEKLSPYGVDVSFYDLANMPDETFATLLEGTITAYNNRIEAQKKAEADRIAKEKAEAEEREKQRLENIRLKAEAESREKKMAEERAKAEAIRKAEQERADALLEEQRKKAAKEKAAADAKLKAEREAREKAEKELKAKQEAEAKAKRDAELKAAKEEEERISAAKKAQAAPDKIKLKTLADEITNIALPEMKTEDGQKIIADVEALLLKVSKFINDKIQTI